MKKLKRFFVELHNPPLKCERVGHKMRTSRYMIMMKPEAGQNSVGNRCRADIYECKKCGCGYREEPTNIEHLSSYTSITMSEAKWDLMRKRGYIFW